MAGTVNDDDDFGGGLFVISHVNGSCIVLKYESYNVSIYGSYNVFIYGSYLVSIYGSHYILTYGQ